MRKMRRGVGIVLAGAVLFSLAAPAKGMEVTAEGGRLSLRREAGDPALVYAAQYDAGGRLTDVLAGSGSLTLRAGGALRLFRAEADGTPAGAALSIVTAPQAFTPDGGTLAADTLFAAPVTLAGEGSAAFSNCVFAAGLTIDTAAPLALDFLGGCGGRVSVTGSGSIALSGADGLELTASCPCTVETRGGAVTVNGVGFALPAGAVECRPGAMVLRGPEDTPAVLTGTLTMPLLISGAVDAAGLALGEGGLLRLSGAAASRLLLGEHNITLSAGVAEWNGVQAIETSGTVFAGESCPALTLNGVAVSAGAAALDAERLLLALPEEALGQLTLTPAGAEAPLDWAAPDGENFTLAPLGEGLVQLGLRRGRKHTLTAGGGAVVFDLPPTGYTRRDEAEVYAEALGEFEALMAEAEAEQALPLRYAKLARAEAALLDAAVILPTTAQGGTWTKSRVAPHSAPTVQWGADAARLQSLVVAEGFLTRADREALEALWEAAAQTGGSYDPAAWLRNRGRSLKTSYTAAAYAPPASLDWHSLADTPDLDILANTVTGLLQYDNLNRLRPAMAQRWEVTEDGLRYTFHLRAGANWVTAAGETYAEVTAYDFEAGYRHAAEVPGGLGAAEGLVASATATDRYTLDFTLTRPAPWFPALLTTSAFLPLCRDFVKAAGEQYGEATGPEAQVYCGPFRLTALSSKAVVLEKNAGYFDAASVTLTRLTWRCDGGGDLDTVSVSGGDSYAFLSETASVSSFAALNLDRGTFALANGGAASEKTDAQKRDTQAALLNRAFRQALLHAFDKAAWNAVSRGAAPAEANLRNLFNHPAFVTLPAAAELEGHTFAAGTAYGALVQAFLDDRDAHIDAADGANGWYDPAYARARLETAKTELGDSVTWPIQIDLVYNAKGSSAAAEVCKASIEAALGAENVTVVLVPAATSKDYRDSTLSAVTGEAKNYDLFNASQYGSAYPDPAARLAGLLPEGEMTPAIGLF